MSVQLSQPERAVGVSVVMGFVHLQVTAAASGDIVAPLPSTARLIPSLLLQVHSMDRQRHQPTRSRRANVLKAMSGMISVLTKMTVALSMDIADPASSTAIPQSLMTEVAMRKLEHVVVEVLGTEFAVMVYAVRNTASAERVSCTAQIKLTTCKKQIAT